MGGDRLLFIARPDAAMREVFDVATREQGIQAATGLAMFPLVNWHQTLSDRFIDSPQTRALLLQAGQAVQARGFLLSLDQLRVSPNARASANIELCCSQPVDALKELLLALKLAIADQGAVDQSQGPPPARDAELSLRRRGPAPAHQADPRDRLADREFRAGHRQRRSLPLPDPVALDAGARRAAARAGGLFPLMQRVPRAR